jgi:hypothetical protein
LIWRKSGRLISERLANASMVKTLIYAAAMIAAAGLAALLAQLFGWL